MAKASAFNPLQVVSPVMLIFCMILFFMPWIELQCAMPASEVKKMSKEEIDMAKKEMGFDPTKPIGMYSQSGLQIATGNVSLSSDFKKMADSKGKGSGGMDLDPNSSGKKKEGGTAPLLFLFPIAVIGGIVVGFLPWASPTRKIVVAGCAGLALGVVGLQAMIGFPLENDMKKQMDQLKGFGGGGGMFKPPGGGGGGGKTDGKADAKEADPFKVVWKLPLYLTFLLLIGAAGTAFLGPAGAAKGRKKAYDYDDEDDDEDDDRPRKKKRRDDDEDDDDRPRKKKAMSLDDEDDRPKKKRRDEDDEDDDRPRKKRRDDDEDDEDDRPRKKPSAAAPAPPSFNPPAPPAPKPAAPAAPPPAGGNPFAFDDGEAPPPKKKPRPRDEDDDEDDRPRKKRRRDDDD